MKTITELIAIGSEAALPLVHPRGSDGMILREGAIFWDADKPAREAFARAVRDAVLADQPAADVTAWRPIAEWDGTTRVMFHDGFDSWYDYRRANQVATHFIALPPLPKPDPFEVWWATQTRAGSKAECREIWDAAVASISEKEFYANVGRLQDAARGAKA